MQHPIDFLRERSAASEQVTFNLLREYLQVMVLQVLYKINGSDGLRFGGGTCLRICHGLPRYSEGLDFSLDGSGVSVSTIAKQLTKGFRENNVDFELSVPESVKKKGVSKYWLKFPSLLHALGYSPHRSEKLFIKLEVDQNPPKQGKGEFFFVTKFDQYFPIVKSDLPTLFSGKLGAICHRNYPAMRDFYDLLWYLNHGIEPNYEELCEMGILVKNRTELAVFLREKTKGVDSEKLVATLEGLLENPVENRVLLHYSVAVEQALGRFLA